MLARRLRASKAMTIPDLLAATYGPKAATAGAAGVLALTVPVAYLLMLSTLVSQLTACSPWLATMVAAAFSAVYVGISGFRAVVRTDVLQMVLMFGGFFILLPAAMQQIGGFGQLWEELPACHRSWDGGLGWQTVLVWYLIALQTMVEPSFYQRVFAARSPAVARRGIILSVALWVVFDFYTTFSGLAARVLLPELGDPVAAYPALAELVLPPWLAAIFTVALFATVMSTLDSYLFLAASTIGHDLKLRILRSFDETHRTRIGLAIGAALAVVGALSFRSPVQVWHHVGSVITSALLLPVLTIHLPTPWRFREWGAIVAMVGSAAVATVWILAAGESGYPLGIEPMFPALATCLGVWLVDLASRQRE
jgi:SSS family solute:Na+ symporter